MAKSESKAIAKRDPSIVALYKEFEDSIVEEAKALSTTSAGVLRVSLKGGRFKVGEKDFGTSIQLVVLGWCFENAYYKGAWVEGEVTTPDCFALGFDDAEMVPHKDSPTMQGGNVEDAKPEGEPKCATCWANAFGTATRSPSKRGKACTNGYRLAVIHPDNLDLIEEGKLVSAAMMRLPATSRKPWHNYLYQLNNGMAVGERRSIATVVTTFTIRPEGGAWVVEPSVASPEVTTNPKVFRAIREMSIAVRPQLLAPYVAVGPRQPATSRRASSGQARIPAKHKPRKSA